VPIVNVGKVAEALNLDERRVQQLAKEGMPREGKGQYDPIKCMWWYIRYLQTKLEKRAVPMPGGEFVGLNDQRVRGLRADAELKEMELALRRGITANLDDVRAAWADLVLMAKARLMAIPPRLAPDLKGEDSLVMLQAKIEKAIKDALNQLADAGSNYAPRK
jgi:hypothetical protein